LISWNILDADENLGKAVKVVVAGVDWGFTNPGVINVFAVDGDGRAYLIHEVYRTKRVIDWWIAQGKDLSDRYGIEVFVCDPAEPSYIVQFNANDLYAIGGENSIAPGISSFESRLGRIFYQTEMVGHASISMRMLSKTAMKSVLTTNYPVALSKKSMRMCTQKAKRVPWSKKHL
jgi:hypothetical protein